MNLIYGLVDPRTKLTRYVGKSSQGMTRPRVHATPARLQRDTSHRGAWIRQLRELGLTYEIVVLEHVERREDLDAAERRWIARGRVEGWPLTNLTDGGDGPTGPRPEIVRKKISVALLGHRPTPETRAKMSAARKGKPPGNAGKPASPSARENMRRARLGTRHSPETRARIAASKRGKPRPDLAARNRSQMQRDAVSRACTGKTRVDVAARNRLGRHPPRIRINLLHV